jgi:hypothetical protein
MNNDIYNAVDILNQYIRLEALREEVATNPNREIQLTVSIPNTNLSYTGYFPQVTMQRMLFYKSKALEDQITQFQNNKEVFK